MVKLQKVAKIWGFIFELESKTQNVQPELQINGLYRNIQMY